VYKAISLNSAIASKRRVAAAGIAGYMGINVAALVAGIEFGIQPILHHTADGKALYSPYGLQAAVPAMAGGHLLVFGFVEAIVTALVVKYLQKQDISLLKDSGEK
jgi:cobalt/nickel transport system permease protein